MKTWLPLNARSELANPSALFIAIDAGEFGSGGAGGRLGSRSGGIAPAGFAGSKKPSGLGRVEIFFMLRAASPALLRPGFRPTRGSLASAGRCCAPPSIAAARMTADTQRHVAATDFIAAAP